jgi:hypothetical protein
MIPFAKVLAGVSAAILVNGCAGDIGGGSPGHAPSSGGAQQPPAGAPGAAPGGGTQAPAPANVTAGVAPLRRLTAEQYQNTVRDLLGVQEVPAVGDLPADGTISDRFFSNAAGTLASVDLDHYGGAAEALAAKAVANLATLVPCAPASGDAACAQKFITSFGRRAYRRPLTQVEIDRLNKVYAAGGTFPDGVRMVISAVLQSPKFLYLNEPVPASASGKVVAVDPFALASRLSYFLLDTMPDEPLLGAAESGQLTSADQVAGQARRLMADPRFRATLGTFHDQWLELKDITGTEKDAKTFPTWSPELKAAMVEESRRFVDGVMADDGRVQTLLTAPYSYLTGPLYDLYGVARPASTAGWQKVQLPADQRAGVLTLSGLLAVQAHEDRTSFILRGKLVREALLCSQIAPPPPGVVNNDSKLSPNASARDRAAAHRADPACATCHELFDPIGFAFETYDAVGAYRTKDDAGPIDTKLDLRGTQGIDGPLAGPLDLARKLGGADEVRDCVARQMMRFALGREDQQEDAPSLTTAMKALKDAGGKVPDLVVAVARSDAFRFQKVAQ